MANTITLRPYADPSNSYLPAAAATYADQTLVAGSVTTATTDTGIASLNYIRVRAILKTLGGLAAADTVTVAVQVGTGAALTAPGCIASQQRTMLTNDTFITFDFQGWSNVAFRSYAVTVICSAARTSVLDIRVFAA